MRLYKGTDLPNKDLQGDGQLPLKRYRVPQHKEGTKTFLSLRFSTACTTVTFTVYACTTIYQA